jgi:hypothetical protein
MSSGARSKTERRGGFEPLPVNVRSKLSALWTATLFVFAYVDIFSLYRPDFRADIEAGEISGFGIGEPFLLATTIYIVVPSLMVIGSLVLPPKPNRVANMALGLTYALTIVAGAVGEWSYYVVGSVVEVALLGAIVISAWRWPRVREATAEPIARPLAETLSGGLD